MKVVNIKTPIDQKTVESLEAGDQVFITGVIYSARDSAHKRLVEALDRKEKLPLDVKNQIIYYMGPAPAKPGYATGSAGPTTSGRMDPYSPRLMAEGLKGMIGKGNRTQAVKDAMKKYKAVYFITYPGCGALLSKSVERMSQVAYKDLGPEAIHRLEVEDFPAIVAIDKRGRAIFR